MSYTFKKVNHFQVLGLEYNLSQEKDVQKAFNAKMSVHHPDRGGTNTEIFQSILTAQKVLLNPVLKEIHIKELNKEILGEAKVQFWMKNNITGALDMALEAEMIFSTNEGKILLGHIYHALGDNSLSFRYYSMATGIESKRAIRLNVKKEEATKKYSKKKKNENFVIKWFKSLFD